MKVTVEYAAQAKEAAGTAAEEVEVEPRCSVQQLVVQLGQQHGDPLRRLLLNTDGHLHDYILLFVSGDRVEWQQPVALQERDVVTILSPISGG